MIKTEFIAQLAPQAVQARRDGSPMYPSVRLAQNLLETGGVIHHWYNLGGIKVGSGKPNEWWDGSSVNKKTWEVYNGVRVNTAANFRAYKSVYHFYRDQDMLFENERYARVRAATNPSEQARALYLCGYATDPAYADKIITIMVAYGLYKYDEEDKQNMSKFIPTVSKERIVAIGGKLKYIPLGTGKPYATKATDVRLIRIPKGKASYRFINEKGAKVSALAKKYAADIAINFPFFYNGIPLGDARDGAKVISSAYGKMLIWHSLSSVSGAIQIGKCKTEAGEDFRVQASPLLVENGKQVWAQYAEIEETAPDIAGTKKNGFRDARCQRTFVGVTASGEFLIAVADGRTNSDQGLTLEEMALYMIDKGAIMALNGDGGGSSVLWTTFGGKYAPNNIEFKAGSLNQTLNTGANERAVNHALLVNLQ